MLPAAQPGDFLKTHGLLIFSLICLVFALKLLPDFGIGFDSPKNFQEGYLNIRYFFSQDAPQNWDKLKLAYQIHGAFFFMLSDLFKRFFSDTLQWLDPIAARHAVLPLLVILFLNFYHKFLEKYYGFFFASLTCLILLTYPHFFGHAFNNIKDIPLFVFFSLSILSFYEWWISEFKKTRFLYGFFIALALALLSKAYAVIAAAVLLLWLGSLKKFPAAAHLPPGLNVRALIKKNLIPLLAGSALAAALVLLFYMPGFYAVDDKAHFLKIKHHVAKGLAENSNRGWSLYAFIQVFCVTPVLTLAAACFGLMRTVLKKPQTPLERLMLVWLASILLLASTPVLPVYNGIRLFIPFLTPFCFFAAKGILEAGVFLDNLNPSKNLRSARLLFFLTVGFQILALFVTHPYQTTFQNAAVGGLKGAQEKNIPDAHDYWLTSYREAVWWINQNAPSDAVIFTTNANTLLNFYPLRKDIRKEVLRQLPMPRNAFLLLNHGSGTWANLHGVTRETILQEATQMQKAYEIKRQGGEILTVYYKP